MVHHWPKELLNWHCTVLSLGQMVQLIMIILSQTALIVCQLAQDVFPMAQTLANVYVEPASKCIKNSGWFYEFYYNYLTTGYSGHR